MLSVLMVFVMCLPLLTFVHATETVIPSVGEELILDRAFLMNANISEKNGVVVITRDENVSRGRNSDETEQRRDTVFLVPNEENTPQDIISDIDAFLLSRDGGGDQYKYENDKTYSVKAYSTIYYKTKTEYNRDYILLTAADGGVTISDPHTVVPEQRVHVVCCEMINTSQQFVGYPARTSWSITIPSDWNYVPNAAIYSTVGVGYDLTLKRDYNDTTWELSLPNYVVAPDLPDIE